MAGEEGKLERVESKSSAVADAMPWWMSSAMALGKTGVGKSALLNFLAKKPLFSSERSPTSVTKACSRARFVLVPMDPESPLRIKHDFWDFWDTVGFCDTGTSKKSIVAELGTAMTTAAKINGFFYVISGLERFTAQDYLAFSNARRQLGPKMCQQGVLVVTHADVIGKTVTAQRKWLTKLQSIPEGKQMVAMFENRCVFVDCTNLEDQVTRENLLRTLIALPGSYRSADFDLAQRKVAAKKAAAAKKKAEQKQEEEQRIAAQVAEAARLTAAIEVPASIPSQNHQRRPSMYFHVNVCRPQAGRH